LKAPETRPEKSGRLPSLAITEPTTPKTQKNFEFQPKVLSNPSLRNTMNTPTRTSPRSLILAYKTPCTHLRERHHVH